ncbi:esterase/lipase family protein [Rivibacter subsaxonicus]|uniref:Alpha/beta hydrolase family protein n=1 Tax=Rivibacter subsaxonicus TaxID=457575 RepID=A0A4Q7VPE2_9BURK|nr:alpha/beta fold hydrolase [Rivibacter subsaxonicus]RZT97998.1 alpha/beta hydrolase family protein [Rivibacter subsaxonicus]
MRRPGRPHSTEHSSHLRAGFAVAGLALTLSAAQTAAQPPSAAAAPVAEASRACVVLLHGLGRTFRSMDRIADATRGAGYATVNVDYASRSYPIEKLAAEAVPRGVAQCRALSAAPINFVTHSMGGLVLRYYLKHNPLPELGRVVMMGPPNQGSEIADLLREQTAYQRINGPAGQQIGTGPDGIPARLGPVAFPVGILTGNDRTYIDELLSGFIPGPNDGKVSVERAKVDGMTDFMVLPATHTFIVNDPVAIDQTLYFLSNERFRR